MFLTTVEFAIVDDDPVSRSRSRVIFCNKNPSQVLYMSRISVDVGLFLNTSCVRIIYGVCTTSVARHQIMTCHVKIGVDMHVHTVVFVPQSVDMSL